MVCIQIDQFSYEQGPYGRVQKVDTSLTAEPTDTLIDMITALAKILSIDCRIDGVLVTKHAEYVDAENITQCEIRFHVPHSQYGHNFWGELNKVVRVANIRDI